MGRCCTGHGNRRSASETDSASRNSGGYKFRSPLNLGILLSDKKRKGPQGSGAPGGFVMRTAHLQSRDAARLSLNQRDGIFPQVSRTSSTCLVSIGAGGAGLRRSGSKENFRSGQFAHRGFGGSLPFEANNEGLSGASGPISPGLTAPYIKR